MFSWTQFLLYTIGIIKYLGIKLPYIIGIIIYLGTHLP
jgi:hypothetical protein